MSFSVTQLVNAATGTGAEPAVKVDERRIDHGYIALQVYGTFVGTVDIQGTIATQQEIDEGTAVWSNITSATFSAPTCTKLDTAYPWIRGNVSGYTSGTINVRALI